MIVSILIRSINMTPCRAGSSGRPRPPRCSGVSRATLYAYVSRGYVRSQATAGASRERGYARDDVERLRRRTEERRDPDKPRRPRAAVGRAGPRVGDHADRRQRLYYRGHDARRAGALALGRRSGGADLDGPVRRGCAAPPRRTAAPQRAEDAATAVRRPRAVGAGRGRRRTIRWRSTCAPAAVALRGGASCTS